MAVRAEDLWAVSPEEFLAGEQAAETKSEWVGGVVYNMAGASKRHNAIVSRIVTRLGQACEAAGCLLASADQLVRTEHAFYYPDVVISCDPSDDHYVEHRPCFIVEVLSASTKRVDKHEKRDAYCALPTVRDYWIVDPDIGVVEAHHLGDDGWHVGHHTADAVLNVTCLGIQLRVVDVVGVVGT
jgi:Uma2 family endonuclease